MDDSKELNKIINESNTTVNKETTNKSEEIFKLTPTKRQKYSPKKLLTDAFCEHSALNTLIVLQAQSAANAAKDCSADQLSTLFEAQAKAFSSVALASASTEKKLRFAAEQYAKAQKTTKTTQNSNSMPISVVGRVVYKTGAAAADLKIVLLGATSKSTKTDRLGCYRFLDSATKNGEFTVKVCTNCNTILHTIQNATLSEYLINLILP